MSAINLHIRLRESLQVLDDLSALFAGKFQRADLSIFHQFSPPPTGGGHQFLRALWREAETCGIKIENNLLSLSTRACLFNSFNYDIRRLQRLRRNSVLYAHRVDRPVGFYRGQNDTKSQ